MYFVNIRSYLYILTHKLQIKLQETFSLKIQFRWFPAHAMHILLYIVSAYDLISYILPNTGV